MHASFRTFAIAGMLALHAAHADPVTQTPATPVKPAATGTPASPLADAVRSLARELPTDDATQPMHVNLERLRDFRPSPATAAKLRDTLGTDRPFSVTSGPGKAGGTDWRLVVQALDTTTPSGTRIDWTPATLDIRLDRAGTAANLQGRWDRLGVTDSAIRIAARDMTFTGRQKRGGGNVGGESHVRIAGLRFEASDATVTMDDLRADVVVVDHPKTLDMRYDGRIGAVTAAGERVEDVHVGLRMTNIDKAALLAVNAASVKEKEKTQAMRTPDAAPDDRFAFMKPALRNLGRSMIARGTVLEIDDISARYHGNTASLRGRIGLAGATASDLDDPATLFKRIVARFDIKVPMALVRDIAGNVAAKQAAQAAAQQATQDAPGKAPAAPMPPAQLAQTITDAIVGKLVGGGFARVENDTLVSTVELKGGTLRANGKPVPIGSDTVKAPASQVAAGPSGGRPAAPLPPDVLQARLVDAGCRLPDYPDAVLRADGPLLLVVRYRVDADGKVNEAAVATPSAFPAWDRSVLAALARCTYIPALRNGRPVDLPMTWPIRRRPGTRNPQDDAAP